MKNLFKVFLLPLLLTPVMAMAGIDEEVSYLQERWAEVNYELDGKTQKTAFESLIEEAEEYTAMNPESADLWIWSAIIKSSFAGAKGGLGALGLAKESKAELEKAMKLDDEALNGSAYTSLGTLYYSVPGWPVGFGDSEKAEELLTQALSINPEGIDPNYFYASYLVTEKRYDEARQYFNKAAKAAPRPGRELADKGRLQEIKDALEDISKK
jgi:tetratricopeptide (TPR) repeat protein